MKKMTRQEIFNLVSAVCALQLLEAAHDYIRLGITCVVIIGIVILDRMYGK